MNIECHNKKCRYNYGNNQCEREQHIKLSKKGMCSSQELRMIREWSQKDKKFIDKVKLTGSEKE